MKVAYIIEAKSEDALANLEFWMRESKVKFERVDGLGIALNDDPPPAPAPEPKRKRGSRVGKFLSDPDDFDDPHEIHTPSHPGEVLLHVRNTQMTVESNDQRVFDRRGQSGMVRGGPPDVYITLELVAHGTREVQNALQAIAHSGNVFVRPP